MTVTKKLPIHVELSVSLVKHGYDFLGVNDLGDVDGSCQECGHPIRYEYQVRDHSDRKKYILGSECIYKLIALENWENQIDYADLLNKQLLRAGKWRWILSRDGLLKYAEDIPEPKNYKKDFKRFADDMKRTVFKARKKVKELMKKKRYEHYRKEREKLRKKQSEQTYKEFTDFLDRNNIENSLLNDRERSFLISVWKRIKNRYPLSEKQQKWYDDIKKKKYKGATKTTSTKTTSTKAISDEPGFQKMPKEAFDKLSDWEKKFVTSIKKKVEIGEHLTDKQIDRANEIIKKMKSGKIEPKSVSGAYVGKKIKPWMIKQKTGLMQYGIIDKVHKETEKAIYCDFIVGTTTFFTKWIPKSQIQT